MAPRNTPAADASLEEILGKSEAAQTDQEKYEGLERKRIIPLQGIVVSTPVFDDEGNHVTSTVKFGGREQKAKVWDHSAPTVAFKAIEVPAPVAKDLVKQGLAKWPDAVLDDEGEPVSAQDPLA